MPLLTHRARSNLIDMTQVPDERDVETRATLLPEEQAAGSESPRAQAEAILTESLERTDDPEGTRRASTQTPDRESHA